MSHPLKIVLINTNLAYDVAFQQQETVLLDPFHHIGSFSLCDIPPPQTGQEATGFPVQTAQDKQIPQV
jgi:hypothetical protein